MVGQSKKHSLLEAFLNVGAGWLISFCANLIVLPWFGFNVTPTDALGIGAVFTVIAIARSYLMRRLFNWWHLKKHVDRLDKVATMGGEQ